MKICGFLIGKPFDNHLHKYILKRMLYSTVLAKFDMNRFYNFSYHICILFFINIALFVKALIMLIRLYNSAKKTVIEHFIVFEEH